ncbi:hypothetical protein [Flavihumibacter profundi]|uniref:hypothetical protein n=1 Tax=Flavihumibacter profundi TaxID=2716883 RepID=UPI001CC3926F|nr:hypothetical protein [Flavihumibacter profundi]MBZ5856419.1 hypothetical protein [Flavihumibacter profundi]
MRFIFILAIAALGCNSNQQQHKLNEVHGKAEKCFEYPSAVDSLRINDLYDSARWFIYTWHCDQVYKAKEDTLTNVTFGELPLRFTNLSIRHDTLELNFDFIDKGKAILSGMTRDFKQLSTGVGFNIKSKKKIYMLSPNGFSTTIKGGPNRYETPLQPEILEYLESNKLKLDECFKELVKRKGMLN